MSKTDCYLVKKCMVNMCSKSGSLENDLFFGILRIRGVGTVKISGEAPKKMSDWYFCPKSEGVLCFKSLNFIAFLYTNIFFS